TGGRVKRGPYGRGLGRYAVLKQADNLVWSGGAARADIRQPATGRRGGVVYHAGTGAKHGFAIDLVGHTNPRSDGVGIVIRKVAFAGVLVLACSEPSRGCRIRDCGSKGRVTAVLLARVGSVVPAHTVVQ